MLDRIAESFGETCYEVPVGFKHISAKMAETDALIGGESSGGLTVRGHINGKDGIYAATLLVEMIALSGKKLSQLYKEIQRQYGYRFMAEYSIAFAPEQKEKLLKIIYEEKRLPDFSLPVEKVSYLDGCKVYFQNGGWITARFSGTEPLLRIFCEMKEETEARKLCELFREFLKL